jgi:hypothetical protein
MATCLICNRKVGPRAILLYETPKGPAYVCPGKCLKRYNGEEEQK